MSNPNTNKLAAVKTIKSLILKLLICKNCWYQCAYDYAQLCCTVRHRTVL